MPAGDIEYKVTTWAADRPALETVRRRVFVVEQGFTEEEEFDTDDPVSVHVLATLNRDPVGTGRLNPAGKIGRIAVIPGQRGRGAGAAILRLLLQEASRRGVPEPTLHAQLQAVPFYEKFGFSREGQVFDEAGILHVRMKLAVE